MRFRFTALLGLSLFALAGCVAADSASPVTGPVTETVQPVRVQPTPTPTPVPAPAPIPARAPVFTFDGELTQGGWIRGTAPGGTVSAKLDDQDLILDEEGRFFAAFDRDSGPQARLTAVLADGRTIASPVACVFIDPTLPVQPAQRAAPTSLSRRQARHQAAPRRPASFDRYE